MSADAVNGLFELVGSILTLMNVRRVVQDRGYAGIRPQIVLFFLGWGFWNLYFYPALGQWWSFAAGVSMTFANILWISAMGLYGRKR